MVTVGSDLALKIFGKKNSDELDDVIIKAKTDKTGECVCEQEDLSVIFCTLSFKNIGEFDSNNSFVYSDTIYPFKALNRECGLFNLHMNDEEAWHLACMVNVMEITVHIKPNDTPIPCVTWDIKREKEAIDFIDGFLVGDRISYSTTDQYSDDDRYDSDEDLEQNIGDLEIFSVDAVFGRMYFNSVKDKKTMIGNFREWVEVKIKDKWFVASNYCYWKTLLSAENFSEILGDPDWQRVSHNKATSKPQAVNEIESGNYVEDVSIWTQD